MSQKQTKKCLPLPETMGDKAHNYLVSKPLTGWMKKESIKQ